MANRTSVTDSGDLRKYFAALPNVVFKLGLNPYELALYAHFKQAAGDDGGVCWKSRATVAKEAGMSAGMVTKARQALEIARPELNGMALITVKEEPSKTGGNATCAVSITDIWPLNMSKFSTSPHDVAPSPRDVDVALGISVPPSPHDERGHTVTRAPSPHDLKEELLKKNPEEDKRDFISKLRVDPFYSHVEFDVEVERMRRWLARPENRKRRMTERFVLNWIEKIDRPVDVPRPSGNGGDRAAREAELKHKMGWDKLERTA